MLSEGPFREQCFPYLSNWIEEFLALTNVFRNFFSGMVFEIVATSVKGCYSDRQCRCVCLFVREGGGVCACLKTVVNDGSLF